MSTEIQTFLAHLKAAEHVPRPPTEEWKAMIERTSVTGRITDIDEETYDYFLDVLPVKYQRNSLFAFAEGQEPLRLFWLENINSYCCRQLTWHETSEFCRVAGIHFPYWF